MEKCPDRWVDCPPHGELIEDTFVAMKTFLNEDYDVPPDKKFTPEIFFEKMKQQNIDIGLVINLTFSTRYYNPDTITEDHNVMYKSIPCRGHNEAPQEKERSSFISLCSAFVNKNPNKAIAVHCTHGFNRTGYMICSYLYSVLDWSIDAAIAKFAAKREPGIYKQDYINQLFSVFGDSDDVVPQAPPRPIWDSEEDFTSDPSSLNGVNNNNDHNISNHNNTNSVFYEDITDVQLVRDESLKRRIYAHCCGLCNFATESSNIIFPGAQPVSMDRENIKLLRQNHYRVSWKADGCRYMLYIQDENNMFFLNRNLELWRINCLKFPRKDDLNSHLVDTLLDGEMVTDVINNERRPAYLIYDVISLNGDVVAKQNFDRRCYTIKRVIVEARTNAKHHKIISSEGEPFKVVDKSFSYIHHSRDYWEKLKVPHEKDGLIFQPLQDPYTGGTCPTIMKWKPPSLNSIDFKLVIRNECSNGCLPEEFGCLYVSNKRDPINKVRITRDMASWRQYNNKIVEMTIDQKGKWSILRERTDKTHPNSYETAHAVFKSIREPVTKQFLFEFIASLPETISKQ